MTGDEIKARIAAHGYRLRLVEWCEDARTPGLLGQVRGLIDHARREITISLRANPTPADMLDILARGLRRLDESDRDCGNRDVLGHGGPSLANT